MNRRQAEFTRLDQLRARDDAGVAATGRTIVYLHPKPAKHVVVLLHGLSKNPSQFERIARDLFARGHNVLVPRLPKHGHADPLTPALARLQAEELCGAVAGYVDVARELGERVTVAGFSLGGLLAAWTAQRFGVARAVAVAPFLGISLIPNRLMGATAELLLRAPNRFLWWNPILRERRESESGYPRYATHALAHSYRIARTLLDEARTSHPAAEHVTLVTNASEVGVNNSAIRRLYERWRRHRPESVELAVLTGLPVSHDLLSPQRRWRLADRAHPQLLRVIDPEA